MEEARAMALDAAEGYVALLVEDGEAVPESDPPGIVPRFDQLAQTLRDENLPTRS
jgi:hypothetical protein